jgi:pimeloyl-ACP methyl ester carboxylesterase
MHSMHQVRSPDGTNIAYEKRGHGPPLVMVHGSSLDHARWGSSVVRLAQRFTLLMMDRRGRGASGDGPVYSIEREFEDVAAVVDAAGGPVHLLGHSYGAVCAMEASRLTSAIDKLVLYEPPFPVGTPGPLFGPNIPERLDDLLQRGERDALVEIFLRQVVGVSEAELQALRRSSTWRVRMQAAHTLPREVRMAETYRFDPARHGKPTLHARFDHGGACGLAEQPGGTAAGPGSCRHDLGPRDVPGQGAGVSRKRNLIACANPLRAH